MFPRYIGENSTPSIRGALGACSQLAVTIGIFLVNLVRGVLVENCHRGLLARYIVIKRNENHPEKHANHIPVICDHPVNSLLHGIKNNKFPCAMRWNISE